MNCNKNIHNLIGKCFVQERVSGQAEFNGKQRETIIISLIIIIKNIGIMDSNEIFGVQDEGRTAGLCSYFFVLGWSLSYFGYHHTEKTHLGSFQLRQTLFLYLTYLVVRYGLLFFLGSIWLSSSVFSSFYFIAGINFSFIILWIIGLTGAINGEERPIPVIGHLAQAMFSNI